MLYLASTALTLAQAAPHGRIPLTRGSSCCLDALARQQAGQRGARVRGNMRQARSLQKQLAPSRQACGGSCMPTSRAAWSERRPLSRRLRRMAASLSRAAAASTLRCASWWAACSLTCACAAGDDYRVAKLCGLRQAAGCGLAGLCSGRYKQVRRLAVDRVGRPWVARSPAGQPPLR